MTNHINHLSTTKVEDVGRKIYLYRADQDTTYKIMQEYHEKYFPNSNVINVRIINQEYDLYAVVTHINEHSDT